MSSKYLFLDKTQYFIETDTNIKIKKTKKNESCPNKSSIDYKSINTIKIKLVIIFFRLLSISFAYQNLIPFYRLQDNLLNLCVRIGNSQRPFSSRNTGLVFGYASIPIIHTLLRDIIYTS